MPFKKGSKNVFYKHGLSQTRFYRIYRSMFNRCENENSSYYHVYGGKGIKICKKWNDFREFKEDMYESYLEHVERYGEKNTSIDRINRNRDYKPSNCRWADPVTQSNNSSNCRYLKFMGKEMSMTQWSRETGISYNTLRNRINKLGWSTKKSLTLTPVLGRNQFYDKRNKQS